MYDTGTLAHSLERVAVFLREFSRMELYVVRRFWHFDDLRETRCALPDLCWRHVVAGVPSCGRIPLPRVAGAALLVLDLHTVDFLLGTFRKCADMPVRDVSS